MGELETQGYPLSLTMQLHEWTMVVDRFYTPVLCLLGAIGNSMSLLVFCLDSKYRSQSASYYLSALALSDTGYLVNLFLVWLESVRELVITSDIICPLVMYLGQVTCFLSIYIIVAFSIERYRAVHQPLTRAQICTRSKARRIIAFLTVTALLLFSYAWLIARVVEYNYFPAEMEEGNSVHLFAQGNNSSTAISHDAPEYHTVYRCSVPDEYYQISEIANYLDTFITLIVPFLLITFLNVRISWSLWKFKDIRNEMVGKSVGDGKRATNSLLPASTLSSENSSSSVTMRGWCGRCCNGFFPQPRQIFSRKSANEETELVEVIATSAEQLKNVDRVSAGDDIRSLSGGEISSQICSVSQHATVEGECQQQQQQQQQRYRGTGTHNLSRLSMTSSSEVRVAKTLLLVSSVFLLLNLPLHAVRCAQFIQALTTTSTPESWSSDGDQEEAEEAARLTSSSELKDVFLPTAQLWANMLFNTNFAVNFLLYCASGRTFRKSLRNVVAQQILRRKQTSVRATSSTYIGGGGGGGAACNNYTNNRQICALASLSNEDE